MKGFRKSSILQLTVDYLFTSECFCNETSYNLLIVVILITILVNFLIIKAVYKSHLSTYLSHAFIDSTTRRRIFSCFYVVKLHNCDVQFLQIETIKNNKIKILSVGKISRLLINLPFIEGLEEDRDSLQHLGLQNQEN